MGYWFSNSTREWDFDCSKTTGEEDLLSKLYWGKDWFSQLYWGGEFAFPTPLGIWECCPLVNFTWETLLSDNVSFEGSLNFFREWEASWWGSLMAIPKLRGSRISCLTILTHILKNCCVLIIFRNRKFVCHPSANLSFWKFILKVHQYSNIKFKVAANFGKGKQK